MVDLSSGDFKYNIPLMDVGGYPLNIAYDSGPGMDQEASWVGLGWNLNVGAINRNMRGLPDDFNKEIIEKEINMKDNKTYGTSVGVGFEIFGWEKSAESSKSGSINANFGLALTYNNYNGIGMEQSAGISISAGNSGKGRMNAGLGMKSSASSGLTVNQNLSFSARVDANNDDKSTTSAAIGVGMAMNSRAGLKDLSFNASMTVINQKNIKNKDESKSLNVSESGGFSSGGVINFGASTYIPQVQNSMVNNAIAVNFKLGVTLYGADGDITFGGFFSQQSLLSKHTSLPAYGYMFSHNGQNSDDVLMDFNREKDQAFSRYTKNLPITNQTYDVFSVSGQGIGGSFRPFRSDVGYMFDNSTTSTNDSYSAGVEFAGGNVAHLGVNLSIVDVNTTTGKWDKHNLAKTHLSAKGGVGGQQDYEPFYFKEVGEKSVSESSDMYNGYGGDRPYRIKLTGKINHKASEQIESMTGSVINIPSVYNYLTKRQKRNQVLSTLNFEEAKKYGLDKSIYDGTHPTMSINSNAKTDHIAQITALRTDGSRYIYGLPAYNTKQLEATFNASEFTTATTTGASTVNTNFDKNNGYVSYNSLDRSKDNKKGVDNYFSSTKLPAYAHSYLLTAIISPDYVDLTGDGPTDDDFGNYTKFEYERVADYNWRMPFDQDKANFNEVGKSVENDDQGNFVAGTKELWFTTKIETKNYVAIFDLEDRLDAAGAGANEDGGIGAERSKRIKTISLYSKPEYKASGSPVPIKVVHFEYDYSLCEGVVNKVAGAGGSGKLTLKHIYFTYGKSDKASFSKYDFTYNQAHATNGTYTSNNFDYHPKAYDRWGNFKPLNNNVLGYDLTTNPVSSTAALKSSYLHTDELTNFRISLYRTV